MGVDLIVEAGDWDEASLQALADRAFHDICARLELPNGAEVAVLACDDARIADLNTAFRGKPAPTNVLSWPAEERAPDRHGDVPHLPMEPDAEWGDIAIAYGVCRQEAKSQGKSFDAHVSHLLIHGMLHLLGFDHETEEDARRMEQLEVEILAKQGLPDPYLE